MGLLSRRQFISSLLGAALALEPLLEGCATFSGLMNGSRMEQESDHFIPANLKLIPFQEYHPAPAEKKLTLDDRMLETYLTKAYSLDELDLMIMNHHVVKDPDKDPIQKIDIKNYQQFSTSIMAIALDLGYTPEQVQSLSVHEAVMLSGKIVAKKLEYDQKMIGESLPDIPPGELFRYLLSRGDIDDRPEEAKRIDSSTKDEIFQNGQGICRNYAGVNAAVFQILKDLNPNLRNTNMRFYTPDDLGHVLALPHGWNLVSTVVEGNSGIEVQLTYVDPTWLDTKNRTVSNTGEKDDKLNDEEIYDALDEAHFGKRSIIAQVYMAKLQENLGNYRRKYSSVFPAPQATRERHQKQAYTQWLDVCNLTLDVAEEAQDKPTEFDRVDSYFANSFQAAIENFSGHSISSFLKEDESMVVNSAQEEQFQELKVVYQRALSLVPEFLTQRTISYNHYSYSPSKEDKDIEDVTITTVKTSPAELYQKLAAQFEPK